MMQTISSLPYVSQRRLARQRRISTGFRFLLLAAFMSFSFLLLLSLLSGRPWSDPVVKIMGGSVQIPPSVPDGSVNTPPQ